ncbi:MAG: GIY-YIG nuclease family protein [Fibrobacter sp.]|nr:GIY-YIG nuclease family protein [Fibrobacter sp.]
MPHFVYMLRCKGNRIYTGYAVDVQARFEEHCSGRGAKFTKAFPPECVLRTFELSDYRQALRLEARIKKLKRPQKELLAAGDETLESELLAGLGETLKQRASRIRKEKVKSRECKGTKKKICTKISRKKTNAV